MSKPRFGPGGKPLFAVGGKPACECCGGTEACGTCEVSGGVIRFTLDGWSLTASVDISAVVTNDPTTSGCVCGSIPLAGIFTPVKEAGVILEPQRVTALLGCTSSDFGACGDGFVTTQCYGFLSLQVFCLSSGTAVGIRVQSGMEKGGSRAWETNIPPSAITMGVPIPLPHSGFLGVGGRCQPNFISGTAPVYVTFTHYEYCADS